MLWPHVALLALALHEASPFVLPQAPLRGVTLRATREDGDFEATIGASRDWRSTPKTPPFESPLGEAELTEVTHGRLLVLTRGGASLVTCDADGGSVRRLFPLNTASSKHRGEQVQHPVFSPNGELVAFVVLTLAAGKAQVEAALQTQLFITEEATGDVIASGRLPQPPFHLAWGPDGKSVNLLCDDGEGLAQLMEVCWDTEPAAATAAQLRARVLDRGGPLYYATLRNGAGASPLFVAHNGVRGGVSCFDESASSWQRIAGSALSSVAAAAPANRYRPQFRAPQPLRVSSDDSEEGAEAVLLVEDGWLVSAAADGSAKRRLARAAGRSAFAASPDGRFICLSQSDAATGQSTLFSILSAAGRQAYFAPDANEAIDVTSVALKGAPLAFWWSPDSLKLLVVVAREPSGSVRDGGAGGQCEWVVLDCTPSAASDRHFGDSSTLSGGKGAPSFRLKRFGEGYRPRRYFAMAYLAHFDQLPLCPWSPDSRAFAYAGEAGAFVQSLATGQRLGLSKNAELVSWAREWNGDSDESPKV